MGWQKEFHRAVAEYLSVLHYQPVDDIKEVLNVASYDASFSGCDSCGWDSAEVHVKYLDNEDTIRTWIGYMSMTDFMENIERIE